MLDLKFVVENIEEVIKKLETRQANFSYLRELVVLQDKRKQVILDVETLKAKETKHLKK